MVKDILLQNIHVLAMRPRNTIIVVISLRNFQLLKILFYCIIYIYIYINNIYIYNTSCVATMDDTTQILSVLCIQQP